MTTSWPSLPISPAHLDAARSRGSTRRPAWSPRSWARPSPGAPGRPSCSGSPLSCSSSLSASHRGSPRSVAVTEYAEEEEEHVEGVEEDRCRDQRSGSRVAGHPQPLEVDNREAGEDQQPDDGVDERAVRDVYEDQD